MGRKYRPKPETGDEYVEDTKKLYRYTQEIFGKMPFLPKEHSIFDLSVLTNYILPAHPG